MGLAEPRKRIKISHDPNNLSWAQAAESYGQKLLSSQGWRPGQGLGARRDAKSSTHSTIPTIRVTYKDDNLGLGASLHSKDQEHVRTGLDAFQSLLGRLNSKDEAEVRKIEKKAEDRKLALWTRGKWGGVIFVPGGVLGGEDEHPEEIPPPTPGTLAEEPIENSEYRAARKAAKAVRKAERQREKLSRLNADLCSGSNPDVVPNHDDPKDLAFKDCKDIVIKKKKKQRKKTSCGNDTPPSNFEQNVSVENRQSKVKKAKRQMDQDQQSPKSGLQEPKIVDEGNLVTEAVQITTSPSDDSEQPSSVQVIQSAPRCGRHIIRSRNIQAKKMAFADAKMLDEIFMRRS